ncbi:40657_t:CDS:2 [Gigaspora margarita]|uniref:40657_t:CDS:1 n=1 Tax=Gigaspora margarita TaxID=4874 RepID=A0ABN7V280_GIGMA|nr:40657_t:CDS:2 [Gigaspora margarita]
MKRSVIKRRKRVALATSPPPPASQSGGSDNEHPSRKSRIHHPPTPASTSGSERGYISSEDEISIDDLPLSNRKRKVDDSSISNKRRCSPNGRQVPPIEDYVCNKLGNTMWDDRRKRSLSPVEPIMANQVHIHQNNFNNNTRIMGTPSVPLPSVFPAQYNDGSSSPSQNSSSSISALLNPTTPTSSSHPQLPPLSSIPSSNMVSSNSPSHLGLPVPANSPTSPHQPQSNSVSDRNSIQLLQAHRQELQREVSHLSMLLNKTTAILVDLDKAISSNNSSLPNTPFGSPDRSSGNNYGNGHTMHLGMPTPPPSDVNFISLPPLTPSGSDDELSTEDPNSTKNNISTQSVTIPTTENDPDPVNFLNLYKELISAEDNNRKSNQEQIAKILVNDKVRNQISKEVSDDALRKKTEQA